jgi:hypothetical protein
MQKNECDVLVSGIYRLVADTSTASVETGCLPCSSTTSDLNRSIATNIFRSFDMLIPRISLLSGSIVAT